MNGGINGESQTAKCVPNSQYQLKTKEELDREAQKFYEISLLTKDLQGLSGIRILTVEVGDQNDSPMFDGESKINVFNYRVSCFLFSRNQDGVMKDI